MIAARIAGATRVLGKSQGYGGLSVHDAIVHCDVNGPTPVMFTAWEPTPAEIDRITAGANIQVMILGTEHPPIDVRVGFPVVGEKRVSAFRPGVWKCPQCGFRLVQANLNARDGSVTARDDDGGQCPNDGTPLVRVTWEEECVEAEQAVEILHDQREALRALGAERKKERDAAELRVEALEAEVAGLRAALKPFATLRDALDGEADDALACPSVPDCQGYALVWADEADGDRVQITAGQLRRARAAYKGEAES